VTRQSVFAVYLCGLTVWSAGAILPLTSPARADESADKSAAAPVAEGRPEVEAALKPIADAIKNAKRSRATVVLTSRSLIAGQVVAAEDNTYQIASKTPNLFSIQLKGEEQSLQVTSDGTTSSVLLGGIAYFQVDAPANLQEAVIDSPVPLGPYPEPLMALTLAGVDLAESLLNDMESLTIVNREPYDDTPALQVRGVQADGVSWVLWVATEAKKERPLRLKVDLTKVVVGDNEAALPKGFAYEIDFKFTKWEMDGEVDDQLFTFKPPADATRYESLEELATAFGGDGSAAEPHALVGEMAPDFTTELLDGTALELSKLRGKVVVLDFWATWCGPCVEAMPVITKVAQSMADSGVVMYAVNIGEKGPKIKDFLAKLKIDVPVALDPEGDIANAYYAEAIPQTVLIGKDGRVEVVHVGFGDVDAFKKELTEQLKALVAGEKLADSQADSDSDDSATDEATK
jgi:thiol-disulfide isomerase/thioredoxin/outer membrane lipoprotein-sorting protein